MLVPGIQNTAVQHGSITPRPPYDKSPTYLLPVPEAQRELLQELVVSALGIFWGPNGFHLLLFSVHSNI